MKTQALFQVFFINCSFKYELVNCTFCFLVDSPKPSDPLLPAIELTSNCTSEPPQQAFSASEPAVVSLLPTVIIAPKESMNGKEV